MSKLAEIIRSHADAIQNSEGEQPHPAETAELLRCLARVVEGKTRYKSFGAPGDWGYGTPIGDAVMDAIRTNPGWS